MKMREEGENFGCGTSGDRVMIDFCFNRVKFAIPTRHLRKDDKLQLNNDSLKLRDKL